MYERRWPLIAALLVGALAIGAIGFVAGRSSAPESSSAASAASGAVRIVDGVPVGIEHSRAGALAAADNYVAVSSETVVQDPRRYEKLVRRVYAPAYQSKALREGEDARASVPDAIANYDAGGRAVSIIAARRLDTYSGNRAKVTTWRAGVVWGPTTQPATRWFLTETALRWTGDRWVIAKIEDPGRAAPSPVLRYRDRRTTQTDAFERDLHGMTAPEYGVAK